MTGVYSVKLNRDRSLGFKYWGGQGNKGPMPWRELVDLIANGGIKAVRKIQHADKEPKNYHQLDDKEMLKLWKAVDEIKCGGRRQ
jgi:hypothetical protein